MEILLAHQAFPYRRPFSGIQTEKRDCADNNLWIIQGMQNRQIF